MKIKTLKTRYDVLEVKGKLDQKEGKWVYSPSLILVPHPTDIMTRGGDLYAVYDYDKNIWVKDRNKLVELFDIELYKAVLEHVGEEIMSDPDYAPSILYFRNTDNHMIDKLRKFVTKDMGECYKKLNQKVISYDQERKKEDHVSYVLGYSIKESPTPYYDKLVNRLYPEEEARKFEWAVGCILSGEQSKIQKIFVFYGLPGSGKGTIIHKVIVDTIFEGASSPYCTKFTAELLANRDSFGTGFLTSDPLLAFDDDADLSRIESNTTLNLIVSHEAVRVNEKFMRPFDVYPNCLLFCGTNEPVQLSQNSGLIRRVIDIRQTGDRLSPDEYDECVEHLKFEQSGIAWKCLSTYKKLGKNYYNKYQPEEMLSMTSPFHNFVKDSFMLLEDGTSLTNAYKIYKEYCEESNYKTVLARYKFRDSLKLYFEWFGDILGEDGKVETRDYFKGFKYEKIGIEKKEEVKEEPKLELGWLKFNSTDSYFDKVCSELPAQYANSDEKPIRAWKDVTTRLKDLNTSKIHYVNLPETHVVLDFDLKDKDGNKSMELNMAAANKLPPTYAELSKSGGGIHLHYIYIGGDPNELSRIYAPNIEVKVFTGDQSLRRRLSKCNDLPIAELSCGLKRKEVKVIDSGGFRNVKELTAKIVKTCNKEYDGIPSTKCGMDFIEHLLNEAYASGKPYDVSDLKEMIRTFAHGSTHQRTYCLEVFMRLKLKSNEKLEVENDPPAFPGTDEWNNAPIVIFDIESYPGDEENEALFDLCWTYADGDDTAVVALENPKPEEVEKLFRNYRMVGFNNRKYDNHICMYRAKGCTPQECNNVSQRIIDGDKSALLKEAYGWSYTDILDFASAANKMGLKKWEYKLQKDDPTLKHMEMGIPWDKPVPKELRPKVLEYCSNDVQATKALWKHLQGDFKAREILAVLSGLTVNDTTNQHTTRILTAGIKDPKQYYIYTDLSTIFPGYEFNKFGIDRSRYNEGIKIVSGKSIYKGIDPGEGGRKIGYPGAYENVGLFDVASMHPHSAIRLKVFGDEITERLEALVEARVAIKHGDYDKALNYISKLGNGAEEKVKPYLTGSPEELKANAKALADALKTAINSVYGLTSASFDNALKDPRNEDNIVAKYGALFMINLEEEVTKLGYKVVHVSTDSIKIANADDKIVNFVMDYGKQYGYTFEYEALYSKMCLINDAVYIAKVAKEDGHAVEPYWTATGKQFAVPYVFKTLFSHEPIIFEDEKETFNVKEGAIYLDYNEELPDATEYEKELKKLQKKFRNGDESVTRRIDELIDEIAKCHDYVFVGGIGQFTPVAEGQGGGILTCIRPDGRVVAVQGTKGYRWLESQRIEASGGNVQVDESYYIHLVDDAVDVIKQYCDFDWFVSDDDDFSKYMNIPEDETRDEVPFEELPFK